jgi:hypothetical protein
LAEETTAGGGLNTLLGTLGTASGAAGKALSGTAKAAVGLGGALLTGQQQLSAYSGAISANTGLFGKTVGKLVDGLSQFAEASLAEYQQLTSVGATFGKEIKDVKVSAAELGLSVEEMTGFLKKNSESLRAFGGTTDLAISRFKAVSTTILDSAELGTKLRQLGFTTADINENLALYGELSDANSRTDRASVEQQAAAAKNLMVELDGLSKLTGKQRDALADEMKERRRQGDVNAFLSNKTAEEQTAFTTKLVELQNTLGKDAADAFVDVALRGAPTTESTRAALLAMGSGADDLYAAAQQFNAGDIRSFQDSLQAATGAAMDYQDTEQFRQTAMLGGMSNISSAFADASAAGYNYKNAVDSVSDGTMTAEEARETLNNQILQEQARQMEQTTGIFDKTIGIQEDLRTLTTTVMETTIPHIENVAVAALDKISEVMPSAQTIANELAGGINNLFNAAEFLDTNSEVIRQGHGNIVDQLAELMRSATSDAEALGATTTATGETTDANVSETATTTQDDIASARASLEAAQAELLSEIPSIAAGAVDRVAAAEAHLSDVIINSVEGLADIQAETLSKVARYQANPSRYSGGFANGGRIGAGEYGMVGEAGPEFISGPANVMSANTSMGVMQNLMKGIKSLDANVQNNGVNGKNTISNNNVAEQMSNLMASKFDTMIQQLQTLVTIESSSVSAQQKTFRATKSLQGNMLKGTL